MQRRSFIALAGAALPSAALAFPERGITLIVPFPPAGSTDIAARLLADRLSARLSARVVVENRGGAGGAVGSEAAKRAAPDGYTLLFASASSHGANPAVFRDLPYDAVRDFDAVALTGVTPLALAVAPQGPRDLAALRGLLAEAPGTYGSAGAGSITHLAAELFLARTRLRAEHIPYRGGGHALEALARGEVSFVFETLASLSGIAGDGRVRLLAVATPSRAATLPNLPTLEEGGLAPFDVSTWNAMLAPRGTLPERIVTLANAVQACLAEPALAQRLAGLGVAVPPPTGPQATARFIAAEVAKFRGIAEGAGLRLERP
ncbi:Bug family tripartite tricarboxylate transporter substrate binding protein [Roseococcus sp. YIM B11640]|uniref:Bug family tripartite tricarboxylate transporter substrate binding protein n=1 Tax=Roseococcus sp. YIM B11640 TaxID=3133973 RepID=UPI003C7E3BA0